jgi:hypothetical protein
MMHSRSEFMKASPTKVRLFQVWETRPDTNAPWRRVKVVNMSLDVVDLEYLDVPSEPDIRTLVATTQSAMLASEAMFRFVGDAP